MVADKDHGEVIRCGFLDAEVEGLRGVYTEVYDVVICGNGDLNFWCKWLEGWI